MREMCQRAAAARGLRVYGKGSSPAGSNIIVHPYEPSREPFIMFDHRDEASRDKATGQLRSIWVVMQRDLRSYEQLNDALENRRDQTELWIDFRV